MPRLDLTLIKPNIMATRFQIFLQAAHERFVAIMTIAEEDPQGPRLAWRGDRTMSAQTQNLPTSVGVTAQCGQTHRW